MNTQPTINHGIPKVRLYLLRAVYLLTFLSLTYENWSFIFFPTSQLDTLGGVAISFWASYGLLMGLGVRYPVRMVPLNLLQLFYKAGWVIGTYLPARSAGVLNEDLESFYTICITAIIIDSLVIPWGYLWRAYIRDFFNFKKPQMI